MTLTTAQLVRLGLANQACYDDGFMTAPDLVKVPASTVTIIRGTDADGIVRPYGAAYFDILLQAWCVVFRGTRNEGKWGIMEWLIDAAALMVDCPFLAGCRMHAGFRRLYESMTAGGMSLQVFIRTLAGAGLCPKPIIFVGHSLGAAIATCAAADLGQGAILVTFASPRVGDDHFATIAMSRLGGNYRLVNSPDEVPRLAERIEPLFNYSHLGVSIDLNSGDQVNADVHAWHALTTYLHELDPAQPLEAIYAAAA